MTPDSLIDVLPRLRDVEVLFGTWGMPAFTSPQLDAMPDLKAVFYAAGDVAYFAKPLLERGICVSSAWQANAVPVAEYTLAQILLACKGYFRNLREYKGGEDSFRSACRGPGVFGETVALIGLGAVGMKLIELLKPFSLKVIAYDKFLDDQVFANLGVERVTLAEAFLRGFVVSNHLADKPSTVNMVHGAHLRSMRLGATFINTGRGRTVSQQDLIETLEVRTDLTALLDVTHPEPLQPNSGLLSLPNAIVTTHIAGSINDEVKRLAEYAITEFDRYQAGEPLLYQVSNID